MLVEGEKEYWAFDLFTYSTVKIPKRSRGLEYVEDIFKTLISEKEM